MENYNNYFLEQGLSTFVCISESAEVVGKKNYVAKIVYCMELIKTNL